MASQSSRTCAADSIAPIAVASGAVTEAGGPDEDRVPTAAPSALLGPVGVVDAGEYDPRDDGEPYDDHAVQGFSSQAFRPHSVETHLSLSICLAAKLSLGRERVFIGGGVGVWGSAVSCRRSYAQPVSELTERGVSDGAKGSVCLRVKGGDGFPSGNQVC
ncbi:hypothetical protein BHM03_00024180 [Ensete ventricosum]|nr:hypothetical protein BHM03_00024180 [Ensete ventricosum]